MISQIFPRHQVTSLVFLPILFLAFVRCNHPEPVKIGISKATPNYINWLKRADSSVVFINLFNLSVDSAVKTLNGCSGLLLSGGEDVYPAWYGKEFDTSRCTEMNRRRDSLEMALIGKALEKKMPVFGVCRGEQILNVYLGGKLLIDLPTDYKGDIHHQCGDYLKCFHSVKVVPNTLLHRISGVDSSVVTTNHHQAVDILSPLLTSNANSNNQLVEGIEWLNPEGKSFLIGVQWHPERMDEKNPLSGALAKEFIIQAKQFSRKINNPE